ncbi:TetR/AcrR family transcriptional regulator [Lysinibacillus yapensis]|uniref:TetR/AcrR family transcriptional regulator n=1 Tax=Ureibacillus yapensis TaxID=2304605 RepID=A0A396SBN8_9BACL|nr:TetR/AcrR family transcriptional regulator [Lysinibacillus yapensis]RHW38734.1 TetR/AcrR family transcriptional regulator [Lysinibacillus yapensis]
MARLSVKKRIIETALDLFEAKGYHGVSVDEIVETASTSKGGFYHNFKSKDALLYEIHDVFISYVLKETKAAYEQHETPIDKVCAMLFAFTSVFDLYKRHITVFYDESAYLPPVYKEVIKEKRTEYRKLIEQVIEEGKASGHFREGISTTITTMAIIGLVNWTYKWYQQNGQLTMEEITLYFNDFILRGILTKKGYEDALAKQYLLV